MIKSAIERVQKFFDSLSVKSLFFSLFILSLLVSFSLFWMIRKGKNDLLNIVQDPSLPDNIYGALYEDIKFGFLISIGIIFIFAALVLTFVILHYVYSTKSKHLDRIQSYTNYILQSIRGGVLSIDQGGKVTSINHTAEKVLGKKAGELLQRHFVDCLTPNDPLGSFLFHTLKEKKEFRNKNIIYSDTKGEKLPIRVDTYVLKDLGGKDVGVILTMQDLSELKRVEERMKRADRLAVVGRLGQKMAHEIRNPLSAIDINIQLLIESLEAQGEKAAIHKTDHYARIVYSEIKRLDELLENFFKFSRSVKLNIQEMDLHETLSEILRLIEPEAIEQKVMLFTTFACRPAVIEGDRNQLKQAFLNIFLNALQAMPEGGQLKVETFKESHPDFIRVEVLDKGIGISLENLDKIFDIYFTTKKGGSGLGLSIAHHIIVQHGGTIDAVSWLGDGSIFSVRLPLCPSKQESLVKEE